MTVWECIAVARKSSTITVVMMAFGVPKSRVNRHGSVGDCVKPYDISRFLRKSCHQRAASVD